MSTKMFHLCLAWAVSAASNLEARDLSPALRIDFTDGSLTNSGTGPQALVVEAPGEVRPTGGLDGRGAYHNHAPPVDGVNYQVQSGRVRGTGLEDNLRSLTVTLWLKAEVPFANARNANVFFFDTGGFTLASRDVPAGSGVFGVTTGNSTQPAILFDRTVPGTPDFGAADVGEWRFLALTLDMVFAAGVTTTTVHLYRGSLDDPVALWGVGTRSQDGDRTTEINNAFGIGNGRNGANYSSQQQFLGEIDDVRFWGSGSPGAAALELLELEDIRRSVSQGGGGFVRGDCDGDGVVVGSPTDAVVLLAWNFQGGPTPPCLAACDVDGDGSVVGSVTDAVYLLLYNFLGGPAPPAPYPRCGPGSSSDEALGCVEPPGCN